MLVSGRSAMPNAASADSGAGSAVSTRTSVPSASTNTCRFALRGCHAQHGALASVDLLHAVFSIC